MKKLMLLAMLLVFACIAQAAPYCAVFSFGTQCFYYSWSECEKAAGDQGTCVINEKEQKKAQGDAPFCVVASYGTQCFYYDKSSCVKAANNANAVCAVNPDR